jgi:hypothetical protein
MTMNCLSVVEGGLSANLCRRDGKFPLPLDGRWDNVFGNDL